MFWVLTMVACLTTSSCSFPPESGMVFATQQACEKHLANLPLSIQGRCEETDTIVIRRP